jgi:hypothetical protein
MTMMVMNTIMIMVYMTRRRSWISLMMLVMTRTMTPLPFPSGADRLQRGPLGAELAAVLAAHHHRGLRHPGRRMGREIRGIPADALRREVSERFRP